MVHMNYTMHSSGHEVYTLKDKVETFYIAYQNYFDSMDIIVLAASYSVYQYRTLVIRMACLELIAD